MRNEPTLFDMKEDKPEPVKRRYFTLRKAQELVRIMPEYLTDIQLQKHIVKLRDFERYTKFTDVYLEILVKGDYFVNATTQASKGVVPKDMWLGSNLSFMLDLAIKEKTKRKENN